MLHLEWKRGNNNKQYLVLDNNFKDIENLSLESRTVHGENYDNGEEFKMEIIFFSDIRDAKGNPFTSPDARDILIERMDEVKTSLQAPFVPRL